MVFCCGEIEALADLNREDSVIESKVDIASGYPQQDSSPGADMVSGRSFLGLSDVKKFTEVAWMSHAGVSLY